MKYYKTTTELKEIIFEDRKILGTAGSKIVDADYVHSDNAASVARFEDFLALVSESKGTIFRQITYADKVLSTFTDDNILERMGLRDIGDVPPELMHKFERFNQNLADVHWNDPVGVAYWTFTSTNALQFLMLTEDFDRVTEDLDQVFNAILRNFKFQEHSDRVNPSMDQSLEMDQYAEQFVARIKDDPQFALTTNNPSREKFARKKIADEPELKDLFDKLNKLGPYPFSGINAITDAMKDEYQARKKHYMEVRKALQEQ